MLKLRALLDVTLYLPAHHLLELVWLRATAELKLISFAAVLKGCAVKATVLWGMLD